MSHLTEALLELDEDINAALDLLRDADLDEQLGLVIQSRLKEMADLSEILLTLSSNADSRASTSIPA